MNTKRKARTTSKLPVSQSDIDDELSRLNEQWVKLHRKRPQYLYHYTNAQGLLGMLQSNRIWATNSRFTNDPTEIAYATRLVRKVLESELPEGDARWLKSLKDRVNNILSEYDEHAKIYIACFCTHGDLLSQWRGYGAVGGGYALGFIGKHIGSEEIRSFEKPEPILRKVIYDRSTQKRLVSDWLKGLVRLEQALQKHYRQQGVQQLIYQLKVSFEMFLYEYMICFKDPAYSEEQEWRIIQYGRSFGREVVKASFRSGRANIVPYTELDFSPAKGPYRGKLPVRLIYYGPTLEPGVTERSLRLLREAFGYNEGNLTIQRSGVPFNG